MAVGKLRVALVAVQSAASRAARSGGLAAWSTTAAFLIGWFLATNGVTIFLDERGWVSPVASWSLSAGVLTIAGSIVYGLALARRPEYQTPSDESTSASSGEDRSSDATAPGFE
jgi:uncharacterized membrane protein YgdD (TMEM256/DUF423 family)